MRNDKVVVFVPLLFFCFWGFVPGALSGFDIDPVRVSTGFECCLDVFVFLSLPLCLCGNIFSPVMQEFDNSQLVF